MAGWMPIDFLNDVIISDIQTGFDMNSLRLDWVLFSAKVSPKTVIRKCLDNEAPDRINCGSFSAIL